MSDDSTRDVNRRRFFAGSSMAMGAGLVAGYGTFGFVAGQFLYPTGQDVGLQFLTTIDALKLGESMTYVAPSGATIVVARQSDGDAADAFIALSSVCPHLGCQVHWEPQNKRFFCPCHNGAFDAQGKAIAGPPEKAAQKLIEFPLVVDSGLLFIEVPLESITVGQQRGASA